MTLRERRIAANLRQVEVAAILNVDPAAVSNWEKGKYKPVRKYRKALSELFKCEESELFSDESKESEK